MENIYMISHANYSKKNRKNKMSHNFIAFRLKHLPIIFIFAFLLSGCAPAVTPMPTPEGKMGFLVDCSGSADNWASCYKAAVNACQGEYKIIDRNESSTPTYYGPLVSRHLIAECKQ